MDSPLPESPHSRNLVSQKRHRTESWWQIWFPLLLISAGIAWGAYLLGTGGSGNIGGMAQIATILIGLLVGLVGLIVLVTLGLSIYAVSVLMAWIPPRAFQLQRIIGQITARVNRVANNATEPLIRLDSWFGAARHAVKKFNRRTP
ncbi:MAG: hypothetical protein DWG76_00695 [Chloroflexi bacterium]|nr:hypothetical protein [Chloroflexota bacterium]MQC25955.1 hypothetical protein [Chloroflexota bacterium]